ncbi:S-adenosyl-L-methionine-dependent methyltransferase [Saccharata proteae CBS 121410]|uniref:S-adenosyl-L-methionine-dependent methyltransferase n=1 Tax=Saccharata proteae CBS 121410 TaxID=1314787 RepID=A0A9P4HWM9_9PEZI|nr:S-adenosyl-L-methionine-dependent methyltransferase [Saccharata proteae CBS 121410]
MGETQRETKDHWSSKNYSAAANFVPLLTQTVVSYLSPQPTDHILDLGCGDGILTAKLASACSQGTITGLDSSSSMISSAKASKAGSNTTYRVADCGNLAKSAPDVLTGTWDKVFSNAAMHWILRAPDARTTLFRDVFAALKPGGAFVFEQGGAGNVAEARTALLAGLVAHGVSLAAAREADPWFFPSETWMRGALEDAGFVVEKVELEYRATRLTAADEKGTGGLEGWVRLFGAQFLDAVEEGKRDGVVRWVLDVLESSCKRDDGSWWVGYVRLRAVARKPE